MEITVARRFDQKRHWRLHGYVWYPRLWSTHNEDSLYGSCQLVKRFQEPTSSWRIKKKKNFLSLPYRRLRQVVRWFFLQLMPFTFFFFQVSTHFSLTLANRVNFLSFFSLLYALSTLSSVSGVRKQGKTSHYATKSNFYDFKILISHCTTWVSYRISINNINTNQNIYIYPRISILLSISRIIYFLIFKMKERIIISAFTILRKGLRLF